MPYIVVSDLFSSMYQVTLIDADTEELELFSLWLDFNSIDHHLDDQNGKLLIRTSWFRDAKTRGLVKEWVNGRPGGRWPT